MAFLAAMEALKADFKASIVEKGQEPQESGGSSPKREDETPEFKENGHKYTGGFNKADINTSCCTIDLTESYSSSEREDDIEPAKGCRDIGGSSYGSTNKAAMREVPSSGSSSDESNDGEADKARMGRPKVKRGSHVAALVPMFRAKRSRLNSFDGGRPETSTTVGSTSVDTRTRSLQKESERILEQPPRPVFKPSAGITSTEKTKARAMVKARERSGSVLGSAGNVRPAGSYTSDLGGSAGHPTRKPFLGMESSLKPPKRRPRQTVTSDRIGQKGKDTKIWPDLSRFYRAVLRWMYIPSQQRLEEDDQSRQKMGKLEAMPVQFESVLQYQKILCRLLLKECLCSLQQEASATNTREGLPVNASGEVILTCCVERPDIAGTAPQAHSGKLYSLAIRLGMGAGDAAGRGKSGGNGGGRSGCCNSRNGGGGGRGGGPDNPPRGKGFRSNRPFGGGEDKTPFAGGDLVALRSPSWGIAPDEPAPLGVVQTWDPLLDHMLPRGSGSARSRDQEGAIIRVVVCSNASGGDGSGGRGGWLSGTQVSSLASGRTPVTLMGVGSLVTASREFQAVMSLPDLPEDLRQCLLKPLSTRPSWGSSASPAPARQQLSSGAAQAPGVGE
ncbi:unnamed protein product, partial [Discosporangium mesarthrocarpum]